MKKRWITLIGLLLITACAVFGADQYTNFSYESYTSTTHSTTLPYRLFVPDGYDPGTDYPVVFTLHGLGKRGDDNEQQMTLKIAHRWGDPDIQAIQECLVVVPQMPAGESWVKAEAGGYDGSYTWDDNTTVYLYTAQEILDHIIATYSIDPDRMYICGSSAGGYGTWDCISNTYRDKFAAALPCAGGADLSFASNCLDVAVWAWHGEDDTTVPPSGSIEMIDAMRAAGATTNSARLTVLPGVEHNSWDPAMESGGGLEVATWMLAQERNSSAVPTWLSSPVIRFIDTSTAISGSLTGDVTDDDPLTFAKDSFDSGPAGDWLTVAANGDLSGTAPAVAGTYIWTVSVDDGNWAPVTQTLEIYVSAPGNDAPVITSTPGNSATTGEAYSYTLTAMDPDGDTPSYASVTLPSWLTFDAPSGVLTGTPTTNDLGLAYVKLSASDASETVEQEFNIAVFASDIVAAWDFTDRNATTAPAGWTTWTTAGITNIGASSVVNGLTLTHTAGDGETKNITPVATTESAVPLLAGNDGVLNDCLKVDVNQTLVLAGLSAGQEYKIQFSGTCFTVADGSRNVRVEMDGGVIARNVFVPAGTAAANEVAYSRYFTFAATGSDVEFVCSKIGVGSSSGVSGMIVQKATVPNMSPVIVSIPVTNATEGVPYSYTVLAVDAEGDSLTYSGSVIPSGVQFDTQTGEITIADPTNGDYAIEIDVDDGQGGSDTQNFTVTVPETQVSVPDVTDLAQATAEADIVAAGLTVGNVTTANHASIPAGNVISQNPVASTQVAPGIAVDLVVSDGPVLTGYEAWASTEGVSSGNLTNLLEYALDGDTSTYGDSEPTVVKEGSELKYIHPQRSDDPNLVYTVQSCTDLTVGGWAPAGVASVTNVTGTEYDVVTNTVPTTEVQTYIRLEITNQ